MRRFKRISSISAVCCLLLAGLPAAAAAAPAAAAPAACGVLKFVGVAGSSELDNPTVATNTNYMGTTIFDLYTKLRDAYSGSRTSIVGVGIRYPAIKVNPIDPAYFLRYDASVADGVDKLQTELKDAAAVCPAEQFVVVGYSQGAQVVNAALAGLSPEIVGRVRAKILFGDPLYNHLNVGENEGRGPTPPGSDGVLGFRYPLSPRDPADVVSRSRSYCFVIDPICQGGTPLELIQGHLGYRYWATQRAADFVTSIEPPALCTVSTATWSRTGGITSPPSPGVEVTTIFGGEAISAKAAPGYRFVGFVAVAEEYTGNGSQTAVSRLDQPSLLTSDSPYQDQTVLAANDNVYYAQARAVPATCGRGNGTLSFAIPIAQDRHVKLSGTLRFNGRGYGGAMLLWQIADPSDPSGAFSADGSDFSNVTRSNGLWKLEEFGTTKTLLEPGRYQMRLAFPGDVNHLQVLSSPRWVVVTAT